MNFSLKTDHTNKLIRYKHSGVIRKEDIGLAWDELLKITEFTSQGYNLLSDYSDSKITGTISEIDDIIDILSNLKEILKGKKQALLVDDPVSTALSLFFENRVLDEVGFIVRVFSTKEEALKWLTT
ncbi:hypothetical protein ACE1ET_16155 [Saccharicrinis sp. FJH62]|uniref:hypothetical protein n=1 Tax=Saccharicrinis sp. FJH62 TaxID=3344657 RepID=UPI0035D44A5A